MKSKGVILIGPSTFGRLDSTPLRRIKEAGFEIRPNPVGRKLTKDELTTALCGVVGVIAGLEPLDRAVLAKSELRVISRCGVGLDNVDVLAARELGIQVFSTPNAPTAAVAELTVGVMITMLRRVPEMNQKLHGGSWEKLSGPQLAGKTVTIVGLGRIGRKVASYLRAFEVRLLAVDPLLNGVVNGITILTLDEALPQSHIISIHASGSSEILGEKEFLRMRPGSYVINTGRGGLIDELALCAALEKGIVAAAWLDTFIEEPYKGPLQSHGNVILTPHIGYSSDEARRQMEMEAVENLLGGLAAT